MKRMVLFVLVFVLFAGGCQSAKATPNYRDVIEELSRSQEVYYSVKDIDGDGTDDLLVLRNTALTVYSYTDRVVRIGEHDFLTGTVRFFDSEKKDYPGIFCFTADEGVNQYRYLTIQDGALHLEELWTEDYSGITGDANAVTEISGDKALIQESKELYEAGKDMVFSRFPINQSNA